MSSLNMSSMPTQNPLQQLYALQMEQAMIPYMGQTVEGLADMGDNVYNAFKGIPDWNKYVNQRYLQPSQFAMNQQLKDLGNTNEYFSGGYQARKAGTLSDSESRLRGLIGGDVMGQREGFVGGLEAGLQRQLNALRQFNAIMGGPLSIQGQENAVQSQNLMSQLIGTAFGG